MQENISFIIRIISLLNLEEKTNKPFTRRSLKLMLILKFILGNDIGSIICIEFTSLYVSTICLHIPIKKGVNFNANNIAENKTIADPMPNNKNLMNSDPNK